ncbi:MAG TPA: lycopene beta-cyclase CrtY [Allosphingosinicella sp.]|nr:lycopene beta-cyclase CrtY [Allosphingosinicella sp.]
MIAGGGLAACLAALAMARHRPEVPLLIVEEAETFGGEGVHHFPVEELGEGGAALVEPVGLRRWPGFHVVFPGFRRNLKAEWAGFAAADLHRLMIGTLAARQYRLGTKVVAVREDALVLDGGEEIRAEGAIDARGAASLSALEPIHRVQLERVVRLKAPHRLDRPVLVDASVDQAGGLRFVQCLPLGEDRLMVADVCVSERSQPDEGAGARIDAYLAARGWAKKRTEQVSTRVRPLPTGGDFAAFWRFGGARVAKLGLRGGFINPATARTVGDAVRTALLLAEQRDFSGAALHDAVEAEAKATWKERELQRAIPAAIAAASPEDRRAVLARLYDADPGLIRRLHADTLGLFDRRRVRKALRAG